MRKPYVILALFTTFFQLTSNGYAWSPTAVDLDSLVRMPGTQPDISIPFVPPGDDQNVNSCIGCHWGNPTAPADRGIPGFSWQGSMMAQAARDPIFWATMTVAAQDSIWVVGRPNATDICLRCHFPEGWLGGRSDQLNASAMTGSDYDGVHCDICHRMYDPFGEATKAGTREGSDWVNYWDESALSVNIPGAVTETATADWDLAQLVQRFNGTDFFNAITKLPASASYTENGSGQMFIDKTSGQFSNKRGPFADAVSDHTTLYSRYHKSKYFCSTCHDVSNPVLANLGASELNPLPTEENSAHSYAHVERTFSEFMSSAYGQQGGAATNQEYQDQGGSGITHAAKCQDCHMPDVNGVTAASGGGILRPFASTDHPTTGVPSHDLQGGNAWTTYILASTDDSLAIHDPLNLSLLNQGPATLTLDLTQGISPHLNSNGEALEAASQRAKDQLRRAVTIKAQRYNAVSGELRFRVQNNTGHKLLSGYPEGRRMFINIKGYQGAVLKYEVNPYDMNAGTLKGLPYWQYDGTTNPVIETTPATPASLPAPVALVNNGTLQEVFIDDLIYEAATESALTGENHTFHFALATGRYKDNRIPPKGFNLTEAKSRLCEPVKNSIEDDPSTPATNLYSALEYAGGYDEVRLSLPAGLDSIVITAYYQGTSREYIEFLRDEIAGTGANRALYGPDNVIGPNGETYAKANGLNADNDNAYLAQTDPFFAGLKAWGPTIWQLWYHNHGLDGVGSQVPGIVPFQMAQVQLAPTRGSIVPWLFLLLGN